MTALAQPPQRIQRRRTEGWTMPPGAIYVGRPTKWGNPYRWQDQAKWPSEYLPGSGELNEEPRRIPDSERRRWAVILFRNQVQYGLADAHGYPSLEEIRRELAGRDLLRWCPEGDSCHADVLLELANPSLQVVRADE